MKNFPGQILSGIRICSKLMVFKIFLFYYYFSYFGLLWISIACSGLFRSKCSQIVFFVWNNFVILVKNFFKFLKVTIEKFLWFSRPVPLHDFTLFVVLPLFTGGSPNADRNYFVHVGGTNREIMKWDRPVIFLRRFWKFSRPTFRHAHQLRNHWN